MLQIILAEDHVVVRDGLKVLIESKSEFKILGEATNGVEVLEILKSNKKADIVLTDINMPIMDGLSLLRELKKTHPFIYVIILTMLDHEEFIAQAFSDGADGYLLKNASAGELVFALNHVSSGRKYLSSELATNFLDRWINSTSITQTRKDISLDLSSREVEVLNLIALGYTNQEISEKLFLSKRTIEGHRQSLIEKTDSKNTAALIRFSVLNGIIK
jgi:DNA-binding NarL/FixJ family response regulator